MLVAFDSETDLPCLFILQSFDFVGAELEDRTACAADEVIVMPAIEFPFKTRLALKDQSLRKPRLLKKFERPINRRSSDAGRLPPHEIVEVVDRQVFVGSEERIDHQIAPRAAVQTLKFEMSFKDVDFISKYSLH